MLPMAATGLNQQVIIQWGALRAKHRCTIGPVQEKPRPASLERIRLDLNGV